MTTALVPMRQIASLLLLISSLLIFSPSLTRSRSGRSGPERPANPINNPEQTIQNKRNNNNNNNKEKKKAKQTNTHNMNITDNTGRRSAEEIFEPAVWDDRNRDRASARDNDPIGIGVSNEGDGDDSMFVDLVNQEDDDDGHDQRKKAVGGGDHRVDENLPSFIRSHPTPDTPLGKPQLTSGPWARHRANIFRHCPHSRRPCTPELR